MDKRIKRLQEAWKAFEDARDSSMTDDCVGSETVDELREAIIDVCKIDFDGGNWPRPAQKTSHDNP